MKIHGSPVLKIDKAWLADAERVVKGRIPGAFTKLRNLTNALSDGIGRVRPGYQAYTAANGGIDSPTGTDILKVLPIQSPASADVHLYFTTSGVKMQPFFAAGVQKDSMIAVNESVTFTGATGSFPANNQYVITGTIALGLSQVDGYYAGWTVYNSTTPAHRAQIITAAYTSADSGTITLTLVEDIKTLWAETNGYIFYRNFHDNLTFTPTYNNDLKNPVVVNVENSVIRFSGGQGSAAGNRGVIIFPNLTRTFLPSYARTFTINGTYASERRCSPLAKSISFDNAVLPWLGGTTLPTGKTYWLGIAPVYDGFQIGELLKYETYATDYVPVNGTWANNFIDTTVTAHSLLFNVSIQAHSLNKRITGLAFYMAQDDGDSRVIGRQNPYYFLKHISLVDSNDPYASSWVYNATRVTTLALDINGDWWNARGETYLTDSGYLESPLDTMYAYSMEETISGRRFLTNTYVTSNTTIDRESVFTNPMGGNTVINSGVIQPDVFSNEEGIYKVRVDPTVGTKINAIVPVGIDEFLVIKNHGLIRTRMVVVDGIPNFIQKIESKDVGLTTIGAYAKDDSGTIFFPSYDDIYSYKDGALNRLIERDDKNDWLVTYRAISTANKEGAAVAYLPELKGTLFCFGAQVDGNGATHNDLQYFLDRGGWKSNFYEMNSSLNATRNFKYFTSLSNGHVIAVDSWQSGAAGVTRMTWTTANGGTSYSFGYLDASTGIIPYFDTGYIFFDNDKEYVQSEIVIHRNIAGATLTANLDIQVKTGNQLGLVSKELSAASASYLIRMKPDITQARRANMIEIIFNTDATPQWMSAGSIYQIDSIEFYGELKPRRRAISE